MVTRSMARALLALRPAWEVTVADSGEQALERLREQPFEVMITDLEMPGLSGLELVVQVRSEYPTTLCVVHSSHLESVGEEIVRRLAHFGLEKPMSPQRLVEVVEGALALRGATPQGALRSA